MHDDVFAYFKKEPKIFMKSTGGALLQRRVKFQFENTLLPPPFVVVERAYFTIQDMLFIKQYVDGVILPEASRKAGISYPKSGVEWASFIRELFKEDVHRSLPHIVLSGKVEIHQSVRPHNKIPLRTATGGEDVDI